jgi:hypothetical protein
MLLRVPFSFSRFLLSFIFLTVFAFFLQWKCAGSPHARDSLSAKDPSKASLLENRSRIKISGVVIIAADRFSRVMFITRSFSYVSIGKVFGETPRKLLRYLQHFASGLHGV